VSGTVAVAAVHVAIVVLIAVHALQGCKATWQKHASAMSKPSLLHLNALTDKRLWTESLPVLFADGSRSFARCPAAGHACQSATV
jgi:hypothetical protein